MTGGPNPAPQQPSQSGLTPLYGHPLEQLQHALRDVPIRVETGKDGEQPVLQMALRELQDAEVSVAADVLKRSSPSHPPFLGTDRVSYTLVIELSDIREQPHAKFNASEVEAQLVQLTAADDAQVIEVIADENKLVFVGLRPNTTYIFDFRDDGKGGGLAKAPVEPAGPDPLQAALPARPFESLGRVAAGLAAEESEAPALLKAG